MRRSSVRTIPKHWLGKPKTTPLNSPWALWIHDKALFIAMAGSHQIWRMPLNEEEIGPYAGNSREDIVDGPLLPREPYAEGYASFAQPSGLTSDGTWLYVADSEGSSIRAVPFDPRQEVRTVIGTSGLSRGRLFTFGDIDGKPGHAKLQHPLGVTFGDHQIFVADTYNDKIRAVDPATGEVSTVAGDGKPGSGDQPAQFREPAGLSYAAGMLYVADTNNHVIRTVDLRHDNAVATLTIDGLTPPAPAKATSSHNSFAGATQVKAESAKVKPVDGKVRVSVSLKLPKGYKINPDAPMRYQVDAAGVGGPIDRADLGKAVDLAKPAASFDIDLPVTASEGQEQLKVSLAYYYCQEGPTGLCKVGSVVWSLPVRLDAGAASNAVKLQYQVE